MQPYEEDLNKIAQQVSFGITSIHIFRSDELAPLQIGYSVTPDGDPLPCKDEHQWGANWLVIGFDETCMDPLFIDTSEDAFPVYQGLRGDGELSGGGAWNAFPVSDTLGGFGHALRALSEAAKGRESPEALVENPLSEDAMKTTLATIREHNPELDDLEFWEMVLTNYA